MPDNGYATRKHLAAGVNQSKQKGTRFMKSKITLAIVALAIGLGAARPTLTRQIWFATCTSSSTASAAGEDVANGSIITTAANFTPGGYAACDRRAGNRDREYVLLRKQAGSALTPLLGGAPSVRSRDGSNTVDVTGFVVYQSLSGTVEESFENTRTGRAFSTNYGGRTDCASGRRGLPVLDAAF